MKTGRPSSFSSDESVFAEKTISERLARGTWIELPEWDAMGSDFMSNEFTTASGKLRAVADLIFLSSHWDTRMTTCDTLEASAAQLREGDRIPSMDLASGYHQFRLHPSMRKWFVVSCFGRWFQYIALPFGSRLSGYRFVRLVERVHGPLAGKMKFRVLHYVDDFLICL
jgi:Reverse transcriptase (RNA-dependent DNA polymerase)